MFKYMVESIVEGHPSVFKFHNDIKGAKDDFAHRVKSDLDKYTQSASVYEIIDDTAKIVDGLSASIDGREVMLKIPGKMFAFQSFFTDDPDFNSDVDSFIDSV